MTKISLGAHPYLLGFDALERMIESSAKAEGSGYPPFNIEQTSENSYTITLAVAGFREDELSVTVEDRQLVLRGRQDDEASAGRVFLHRGIAARQFRKSFVLAEGVKVSGAELANGLLRVDLCREVQQTVVRTIPIGCK